MKISQKQKNQLIRELDAISAGGRQPSKPKKNIKTSKKSRGSQPSGRLGLAGQGSNRQPPMSGISNVLGQNSSIPMEQPFHGSESLGRFNGSVNFTETQFPINPGQAGTFPWLSKEALLWEKYEFDKLEFEFRTTINEFAANAYGRVILGVDYDAADPPPSSRSQAEISRPVTAQAPYFNQILRLRKSDMIEPLRRHYVRPGNVPGGADIKMYDIGNLNFGTDGNINASEVGELWVHYSGKFYTQILESTTTAPNNNQVASFVSSGNEAMTTAVPYTFLMPTVIANGINAVNTAGVITLPAGNYLVDGLVRVTDSSNELLTVSASVPGGVSPLSSVTKVGPTGTTQEITVTVAPGFFISTGTNSISMVATATGAAGVLGGLACLRIVSV